MNTTRMLALFSLALALEIPAAQAEDRTQPEAARLGEHPAVIVARRGVRPDPTANFYLHPARLSWSLQRPTFEDEPPALIAAGAGHKATTRPN